VAYTYSHSLDDASDRSDTTFVNSFDLKSNRASSNFDQRNLLHVSYVYDVPLRRMLQNFLGNINSDPNTDNHTANRQSSSYTISWFSKLMLDNSQWSGVTLFESGIPFTVINGGSARGLRRSGTENRVKDFHAYAGLFSFRRV